MRHHRKAEPQRGQPVPGGSAREPRRAAAEVLRTRDPLRIAEAEELGAWWLAAQLRAG